MWRSQCADPFARHHALAAFFAVASGQQAAAAVLQKIDFESPDGIGTNTAYFASGDGTNPVALGTFIDGVNNGGIVRTNVDTPAFFATGAGNTVSGRTGSYLAIMYPQGYSASFPSDGQGYLVLDKIYGTGANFSVSFDFAAPNTTTSRYNSTNDYLRIEYSVDGGAWTPALSTIGSGSGKTGMVADLNGDSTYETTVGPAFTYLSRAITGVTCSNSFQIRLHFVSLAKDQYAVDNLTLNGDFAPVPEPSAYGLLGAGALAVVAVARRRRYAGK